MLSLFALQQKHIPFTCLRCNKKHPFDNAYLDGHVTHWTIWFLRFSDYCYSGKKTIKRRKTIRQALFSLTHCGGRTKIFKGKQTNWLALGKWKKEKIGSLRNGVTAVCCSLKKPAFKQSPQFIYKSRPPSFWNEIFFKKTEWTISQGGRMSGRLWMHH